MHQHSGPPLVQRRLPPAQERGRQGSGAFGTERSGVETQALLVLLIAVGAVILFVTERMPVDQVALLVMGSLMATGVLTPQEAVSGFSNEATLTVAAMLVLSHGVSRTSLVQVAASYLAATARGRRNWTLLAVMGATASASAFMNNTAVVAILIPVVLVACREARLSPSKVLMPLSFASLFGGICTLIGTSTNILVASLARPRGVEIGMFDMTPLGLIFLGAGTLYMVGVGSRLLPHSPAEELTSSYDLDPYLTEVVIPAGSSLIGQPLGSSLLFSEPDLDVLVVVRGGHMLGNPGPETVVEGGDLLRLRCSREALRKIQTLGRGRLVLAPEHHWSDADLSREGVCLVEAVVAPNSTLSGRTLVDSRFRTQYGATVLAMRHQGQLVQEALSERSLQAGDVLLLKAANRQVERLRSSPDLLVVSEQEPPTFSPRSAPVIVVLLGVVLTAALGLAPILVTATVGCLALLLTGSLSMGEIYRNLEWRVIVLLAGVIPLGLALEKTGVARELAGGMVDAFGGYGPWVMLSALYLATSLLTECMSNNAAAVLLVPIAASLAEIMRVDPTPYFMTVTFAASASFMTPVGYQTNTMVYGAGRYRFADFLRVGTPLNLLFWVLGTLLIPRFWPF